MALVLAVNGTHKRADGGRLLARPPQIMDSYGRQMANAAKVLAQVDAVEEAREATRSLLADTGESP